MASLLVLIFADGNFYGSKQASLAYDFILGKKSVK
jgi:hypothetical protein